MGTIVQEYGPFYGEAVNGTVQGRPNGSVYVPLSNTITISLLGTNKLTQYGGDRWLVVNGKYHAVAQAQDLSSYISLQVYDDVDCTTPTADPLNLTAGAFNVKAAEVGGIPGNAIVVGQSYYLRATLVNNGVAVATSSVVELVGA